MCGYLRGPGGIQLSNSAYLALRLSSHPYLFTYEIRKQSENSFLVQIQNMTNIFFFSYWGGVLVGPYIGLPNFLQQGNKITNSFSYMGPNVKN